MQQNVLIVGPNFYGYSNSVQKAFIELGFNTKVLTFSDNDVETLGEKITFHLSKNKTTFFDKKRTKFTELFKNVYDEFKPTIVFIIKGSALLPSAIEHAKNSITILWMMDSIFRNTYSYNLRNLVNHLFLFEKTDVDRLLKEENIKAHFLPLALDETVYYPIENKKDIDLLFVGALYANRIELLNRVIKHFPNKKIKIYGHLFSPLRQPFQYLFRKNKHIFTNKNIDPTGLNKLYSQAKVCLNIHHQQSQTGVNQRFFEILGAKALELTDAKPFIEENFTKTDLLWYANEQEMIAQIEYALNNYEKMQPIINSGYAKVIEQHTFTKRMQFVLDTINYK